MSVIAKLKYLHIAPRKVRLVADLIRGQKIEQAQAILNFTAKRGAIPMLKLLKSAIANIKHNFPENKLNFYVSKILVDEGPKFKRFRPRAKGTASAIQKKTSHITMVLDEIGKKSKKAKKIKKVKPKIVKLKKIEIKREGLKPEKPKFRPEKEIFKPKIKRGIKRIFRRKAF